MHRGRRIIGSIVTTELQGYRRRREGVGAEHYATSPLNGIFYWKKKGKRTTCCYLLISDYKTLETVNIKVIGTKEHYCSVPLVTGIYSAKNVLTHSAHSCLGPDEDAD